MFIKMDSYGKNVNVYSSMPSGIRHNGNNVYVDGYSNIYLEFYGNTTPVYRTFSGEINQVRNIKIYYNFDNSVNQIGSYKVYHAGNGKVIEVAGVKI